ncbi:MAG: helix-hairpin-helix domain-containing protein [Vicinamibacterales bacterium]
MTRMLGGLLVGVMLAGVPVAGQEKPSKSAVTVTAPVNLNTANVAQLEALPGVGLKTAERIIEYRQKNGGFKKVEEVMNVRGVGEKGFLKLKPMLSVGTPKAERPQ